MTRSQVISNLITKYDKIITGQDKSAIELAVFKIAICQLVDAAFGGGGGGGSTTVGTVSDGIDGSINISTIITRLSSINTNQLTQAGVAAAIQSAADIDTIIARLTAIEANTAGGGGGGGTTIPTVSEGIDASVDIDTIIARLTTITNNQIPAVVSTYTHSTVSVVDTGVTVLAANVSRKTITIINRSATNPVDLFFGTVGAFGSGLPLAFGQVYEINSTNLYRGIITARSGSGLSVSLAVAEGV